MEKVIVIEEVTGPAFTAVDVLAYLMVYALVTVLRFGVKTNLFCSEVRGFLNSMAAFDGSNNLNPTPLSVPSFKATWLLPVKTTLFVGEN